MDSTLIFWLETTFLTSTNLLVIFSLSTALYCEEWCLIKLDAVSGKALITVIDSGFKIGLLWQIIFKKRFSICSVKVDDCVSHCIYKNLVFFTIDS